MSDEKALGFYELQEIRVICWDADQSGNGDTPMFSAKQMLAILDEVRRVRLIALDIQKLVVDATPDHTVIAMPKRSTDHG